MAHGTEQALRQLIADGLERVNASNGGRHLSVVARAVGVDRSTVGRWRQGTTTASVDHCRALAAAYPDCFDESQLVELHAQAAIGADSPLRALTVGATVHDDGAAVHRAAAQAIRADPGSPQNRVCKLTSVHLDRRGIDAVDHDPHLDEETGAQILDFRSAMAERAAEGWKIQNVVVTDNPVRVASLEHMAASLDGPDVEIRAYPLSVPLVLSPLVIANREVFFAYDHRRFERPGSALNLRSAAVVRWASTYFDQLFLDAPFTLRDIQGPNPEGFAALRRQLRPS